MNFKWKHLNTNFRKAFIWSFVFGIVFNLSFDIISYQQLHSADTAGQLVARSYEVTLQLQKLDRALEKLLIPPTSKADFEKVLTAIDHAQALMTDPNQQELLLQISEKVRSSAGFAEAMAAINKMILIESKLLNERLQNDLIANNNIEVSFIKALIGDGLLMVVLFSFFIADIRSRKKIEQNLTVSLNNLRTANLALQEEQQKRQASLKTTVHDLKNPLGAIRGFAELISDEFSSSPSAQEFSETIKRISKNSLDLVDSLLNLPETVPMSLRRIDLIEILEEAYLHMEILAKEKQQNIIKDFSVSEAFILGNQMKLEEMVANLLSNAIKYSPNESRIWLRCTLDNKKYRVEIEDEGQGFTEEDKAKAFQYGQKLSARPTGVESSTGYGLFIAKQIVEQHNGEISICDSKSGKGACVAFEIPALS